MVHYGEVGYNELLTWEWAMNLPWLTQEEKLKSLGQTKNFSSTIRG